MKHTAFALFAASCMIITLGSCKHELPQGCSPTNGGYYMTAEHFRFTVMKCWTLTATEGIDSYTGTIANDTISISFDYGALVFDSIQQFPDNGYPYYEGLKIGSDTAIVFQDNDQGQPRLNIYIKGPNNATKNHMYTLDVTDINRQFIIDFWKTHEFI